jgi:polysaccharide pyruvyl transferase CsaB
MTVANAAATDLAGELKRNWRTPEGQHKVFRVGISGSYGGMNLGDEAILKAMITLLRNSLPVEITVFSRNPRDTLARHHVDRAIPVRELSRAEVLPEVERLDLFILGGGGVLFDAEAATYLREVVLAEEKGVPVMLYAIGAGPLQDPTAQRLVRSALNRATVVTVRERRAQQVLEHIGVTCDIQVTADPAFLLEPESLPHGSIEAESLQEGRNLVGISVREPGVAAPDLNQEFYHAMLANAADYMIDRLDAVLIFVPMERRTLDIQHSHAVISKMAHADRATVLKGEYTSGQILSLMGKLTFAVGMRLHFLMFAALQGVPFVALPYADKVLGFLESLDMAMPPAKQVNAGQLIAHIDRMWDFRNRLQDQINRALPLLQERARQTHDIAVQLLTQRAEGREIQPSETVR